LILMRQGLVTTEYLIDIKRVSGPHLCQLGRQRRFDDRCHHHSSNH
jgi:hypothetical protein